MIANYDDVVAPLKGEDRETVGSINIPPPEMDPGDILTKRCPRPPPRVATVQQGIFGVPFQSVRPRKRGEVWGDILTAVFLVGLA